MKGQPRFPKPTTTIAIAPDAARGDLEPLLAAAGWLSSDAAPLVRLVDARAGLATLAALAPVAFEEQAALVAILDSDSMSAAAYDAGATHIVIGEEPAALLLMLRFAARHARRVRRQAFARRGEEAAPGEVARFLATRDAEGGSPAMLAISLTRFDIVNAAFGRSIGDALLAAAFARIVDALGGIAPDDRQIARGDGAAFEIALATDEAAIVQALNAIEAALARPFDTGDAMINLGARIGVARGGSVAELPARARDALDAARGSDSAAVRQASRTYAAPLARLAADLHRAIDRNEIAILFQPQVALASGAITGVEALARWDHPSLGTLGAETLFAAADRADLGAALSEHILVRSLAIASQWPAMLRNLRIAVNVTAADVARPDFAQRFVDHVTASGIVRGRMTAEITETGLISDLDIAAAALGALREQGVRVAIDDFGTGYSSLAYLKALPLDYLKIDRSLTRDIAGSARDRVIVRGVIAMAHALGLATIAEGVETAIERDMLAGEGGDLYQGYLCAGPLDSDALATLFAAWTLNPRPSPAPSTIAAHR
ncbi:MAG: EAL domain-containing protein [Candidatus Sphingomonas colombiensis]|nr:EAL domain-containing protein [Sphingomonas sp.]WEK42595.1 MAG: EAL domain-containing protein [Sphingomonas sp.]